MSRAKNSQIIVSGALATATPLANGTAAVGVSVKAAREDHVHPNNVAGQSNIRCFYPYWNGSVLNTWRSWSRNTSNMMVLDANVSLGTGATPSTFLDCNFLMINGKNALIKLTLSVRETLTSETYDIFVQKFDFVNGTARGSELNVVTLINESITVSEPASITLKNSFTIAPHTLGANSGLFVAYRQTSSTIRVMQGVQLVFEFN